MNLINFTPPPSFFQEEERCDVLVSEGLKKIWAVELDLLVELSRVCKKHKLQYFAFGGTLLGAVRHQGFIPWDDDIDIAMPMDDYKKLQAVAKEEFRDPYCLQTPLLDPGSYFSFTKLRNGDTTFMSKVFRAQSFNQGAFIDVFPLVECPPEECPALRERVYPRILRCSNYMKRGSESLLNESQYARFLQYQTNQPLEEYLKIQAEFDNPQFKGCGYYTHASLFFNYDEHHYWKAELWEKPVSASFEGVPIPIPNGWSEILTEYYGDFMQLPPKERRISNHEGMIIDMDRPYKDYIVK